MRLVRGLGKAALYIIVGCVALALVGFIMLVVAVDRYGRLDHAAPADAIVILGAQVLPSGEPGPNLCARTQKAVQLYEDGYAGAIIAAGGIAGDDLSAAAVARRTAIELGVPAERVLVADGSNNTREDAERAATVMRANGWTRAIVVSHPLHVLRAVLSFRAAGVEPLASPTSTDVEQIPLRTRLYYAAREAGLIAFDAVYGGRTIPEWLWSVRRRLYPDDLDRLLSGVQQDRAPAAARCGPEPYAARSSGG